MRELRLSTNDILPTRVGPLFGETVSHVLATVYHFDRLVHGDKDTSVSLSLVVYHMSDAPKNCDTTSTHETHYVVVFKFKIYS